jgi:hypothetical protein
MTESLESLMTGEQIMGMLGVKDEPDSVKKILNSIRNVHDAFFSANKDNKDVVDKKKLIVELVAQYKLDETIVVVDYPYFSHARDQLSNIIDIINKPLVEPVPHKDSDDDELLLGLVRGVRLEEEDAVKAAEKAAAKAAAAAAAAAAAKAKEPDPNEEEEAGGFSLFN